MNMKSYRIVILALAVMALTACRSQYDLLLQSSDVEAKYKAAFEFFETKKYKKAASLFESLSMQTTNTPKDDTVRFYWALSNYKFKDYFTAEANFTSFLDIYSRSPFTMEARFLKLDCMYRETYRYELDQNPTRAALMSIHEFRTEFPGTQYDSICVMMKDDLQERLDRKEFENARLYYKMEDYIAAKTALKNVLKDSPDNRYREDVMFFLTKSCYKYASLSVVTKQKERYMEFMDNYYNFVGEFPESRYRNELDQLYNRYQRQQGSAKMTRKALRAEKQADKQTEKALKAKEKELKKELEANVKKKDKALK